MRWVNWESLGSSAEKIHSGQKPERIDGTNLPDYLQ